MKKIKILLLSVFFIGLFTTQVSAAQFPGVHWWGQSKITSSWKDAGNNIKTDNDQDVRITSDWSNYQNYRLEFRVLDHNGSVVYSTNHYRSGYDTEVTSKSSSRLTMYNGNSYRLQVRRENFWDPETHTTGRWTP